MASATTTASGGPAASAIPPIGAGSSNLRIVGIVLAVTSGFLIGSSFVFKKKGLLRSQAGGTAGEGVAYLKSPLWWLGMILMIIGELCNSAAYAFIEAIVVTPLGALSVVISAILSSIFLKETLTFFGWLGCALCILGSIIIALNAPHEATVGEVEKFKALFLAPGFLIYGSFLIVASLVIIFYFGPKYGKKSMLWYISVCSMIGGISVSVMTGLGAAIVRTAMGDNQFKHWFIYFLIPFVIITLLTEIYYLNVALALFNTAMVTPTYYVIFTFFTIVTTVVLFQGLKASAAQIITIVMAFLVICVGITVLQMSKVDPASLTKLDRRSTILLAAARKQTELVEEKALTGVEDPGIDTVRGSFGTVRSIMRARRLSQSHGSVRSRVSHSLDPEGLPPSSSPSYRNGMRRHQLYDAPVPFTGDSGDTDGSSAVIGTGTSLPHSSSSLALSVPESSHQQRLTSRSTSTLASDATRRPTTLRPTTLTFQNKDLVHSYTRPGQGDNSVIHEHRLPRSPSSAASMAISSVVASATGASAPPLPPLPVSPVAESGYPPPSARTAISRPIPPPTSPHSDTSEATTPVQGDTLRQEAVRSFRRDQQAQQQQQPQQQQPQPQLRRPGSSPSATGILVPPARAAAAPRPDAREVFAEGVEAPGGLLPTDGSSGSLEASLSESASSEEGQASDADTDVDDATSKGMPARRPVRRPYPRDGPEEDSDYSEERVSLWRRRQNESDDNLSPDAESGSVRLVKPSSGGGRF